MAERKKTKGQTTIYKTLHRKINIEQHEPHQKSGGELRCSGRVNSSCSTNGTRRVTLVTNHPVISHWFNPTLLELEFLAAKEKNALYHVSWEPFIDFFLIHVFTRLHSHAYYIKTTRCCNGKRYIVGSIPDRIKSVTVSLKMCCFSTKYAAFRHTRKDWLVIFRITWSDMSTYGVLFQWLYNE
jgi:hypothetical protein